MIKSVFLFLVLFFIFSVAQSQTLGVQQTLNKYIAASPEASAIAAYQTCPVDYITGIPQISIPLMEIDTKLGKIPFELSYHLGRIKPSELSGPVGFGWTLTPNLGISRSVKGAPDGINSGYVASNSNFGYHSDPQYLLNLSRTSFYDEEPDDFYYSLLNKSGRFIYKQNATFTTIPFEPIKVTHSSNESFIITDVDGTTYKFGMYSTGSTQCLEYTLSNAPLLTSWKVTEIISYDKTDTIKFIYNNVAKKWTVPFYNQAWKVIEYPQSATLHTKIYRTMFQSGYPITAGWQAMRPFDLNRVPISDPLSIYDVNSSTGYSGGSLAPASLGAPTFPFSCSLDYGADYSDGNTIQEHVIDEILLTDVIFRGGKVSLTYNAAQLKSIISYSFANQQYVQVKRVDLNQHSTYFDQENPISYYNSINYRYLLDSVQYIDLNGVTKQVYKASYLSTYWGIMPVAGNCGIDMFGYPTGQGGGNSVPSLPLDLGYLYCNYSGYTQNVTGTLNIGIKSFSNNYRDMPMPAGLLQEITNPTGGTEEFEFEQNVFKLSDASAPFKGAGLRIKNIKYKTGSGIDSLQKMYKYGLNESGIGNIRYLPTAADFISQQIVNSTTLSSSGNIVQRITTINPAPFKDMSFDNGAAVLYPLVTEYTQSALGNLEKTIYGYDIYALNNTRLPNTPLQYNFRDDWKHSSLSYVYNYCFKNNAYQPVQKTDYSYIDFITDNVPVAEAFQQQVSQQPASNEDQLICANGYYPIVSCLAYNLSPGAKKLQQQKETLYDADDTTKFVQVIKNYSYDPATLLQTSQTETNSKNELKQTSNWYPNNISQLTDWPSSQMQVVSSLQSGNRINLAIKQQSSLNSIPLITIQNYFAFGTNGQVYPSETWAAIQNNPLEKKTMINNYDVYGNVLDQQKPNDLHEVYLWGYNGRYVVAKIIGTDYNTASLLINQSILDNSATTDADMRVELNKLRTGLSNTLINIYTFKPLVGMTSETDTKGLITYYEYDPFGRLSLMRDKDNNIVKKYCYNYAGQPMPCTE